MEQVKGRGERQREKTMDDIERKLAKRIDELFMVEMLGPTRKQPQTALRARGNGFEVVELDDAGNIIKPPSPCCYGRGLHAPNCKSWGIT
jgi:hypothetical protein